MKCFKKHLGIYKDIGGPWNLFMQDVTQAKKTWQDILVHAIVVSDRDARQCPPFLTEKRTNLQSFLDPAMSMSW